MGCAPPLSLANIGGDEARHPTSVFLLFFLARSRSRLVALTTVRALYINDVITSHSDNSSHSCTLYIDNVTTSHSSGGVGGDVLRLLCWAVLL